MPRAVDNTELTTEQTKAIAFAALEVIILVAAVVGMAMWPFLRAN